ncbi:MAG: SDR family NAD(P)-dependent oxidoreductase [Labilithrix sp.]|nr:SDR family NAD(P)-dependent oxidoreductase [Labilithrix sp.]
MRDLRGKRVVVTGAASGIGRATAEALAKRGARLYLCDLDEAKLGELAVALGSTAAMHRRVDVSKRDAVAAFAGEVHAHGGPIDVLVNNAGVGLAGNILETSLDDWEWVLSINLWGVIHGCHYFVPKMVEAGRGHVVNVASALGLFATPDVAGYATSKFAVVGLSESMRADLHRHGIRVSTICPGVIDTNIVATTRYKRDAAATRARVVALYKKRGYTADKVAAAIVAAVERERDVVPVSPEAWLGYLLKRVSPALSGAVARVIARQALGGRDV